MANDPGKVKALINKVNPGYTGAVIIAIAPQFVPLVTYVAKAIGMPDMPTEVSAGVVGLLALLGTRLLRLIDRYTGYDDA